MKTIQDALVFIGEHGDTGLLDISVANDISTDKAIEILNEAIKALEATKTNSRKRRSSRR